MPRYTVNDAQTGKTVTFEWHGSGEPTEADMADVFAEAAQTPEKPPEDFSRFGPMQSMMRDQAERKPVTLKQVTEQGPAIGATIGGSFGGFPAIAGAAGGTLVRDLARAYRGDPETPKTPMEAGGNVALNAGGQAMLEGIGPAMQGGAKMLYRGLLKPSKAITREFGDVATPLINSRRLITKGGAAAADEAVTTSRAQADQMVANAPRPSPGVPARRVTSEFGPVREAIQARVDAGVSPASDLDKVVQRVRRMHETANASGGRIDPTRAQTLKRTAQDAATGAYQQMQKGGAKMLSADDLLDAATARGFKGGIEDVVPGIGEQNAATQKLIGQAQALTEAVGRTGNHLPFGSVSDLAALAVGHGNPLLGAVGKASTMAIPGSAMAIGANELGKIPYAQLVRLMQLAQLGGQE